MAASLHITFWIYFPVKLLTMVSLDLVKIKIISQAINYDVANQHTMLASIIKSIYVLYSGAYTGGVHTQM